MPVPVHGGYDAAFAKYYLEQAVDGLSAALLVWGAAGTAGVAAEGLAIRTTAHGAARAGANAARAGTLTRWELLKTRFLGTSTVQTDGARVFYRALKNGRYQFAVYGENGLITSGNWSASSVMRIARRYGWKDFP